MLNKKRPAIAGLFLFLPTENQCLSIIERYLARLAQLRLSEYRCRLQTLWRDKLNGTRGVLIIGEYGYILVATAQHSHQRTIGIAS